MGHTLPEIDGITLNEQGTTMPTLDKLTELLQAVAPGQDFIIQQSEMNSFK